ncbi:hypothetical protein BKA56DRAFT_600404 [Ilyonectria sp. MPI-CAGE-AT-0026]|nr:hypothetical protein BKA56DRAFT_600404 [Ilyonectria sp. MPI-CAGE-AT-0026]
MAGIAAASAAVGVILIGFLIWRCWWYPRHRKQNGQQFHPVGSQTHHAGGPGEFDPNRSPMGTTPIHEMEGVYPTPQQLSTGYDEQPIHHHQSQSPATDKISPHIETKARGYRERTEQKQPI